MTNDTNPATHPAMNAASPNAIPAGIYYSKLLDNFYDMASECGKGANFHGTWYERRAEFPGESSGSGFVPSAMNAASPTAIYIAQRDAAELAISQNLQSLGLIAAPVGQGQTDAERMLAMRLDFDRAHAEGRHTISGTLPRKHTICGLPLQGSAPIYENRAQSTACEGTGPKSYPVSNVSDHGSAPECPTCNGAKVFGTPGRPCPFCPQGSATSGEAALSVEAILKIVCENTGKRINLSNGDLDCYIDVVRAALAASAEQKPILTTLDEYGETDFGFTFAGIQLEEGDKRLATLIVRALGTAHPAMDDLTALLFRSRSAPVSERAAAPASVPEDYRLVPITPDDEMTDAACDASNLYRVDFIRAWDAALLAAPEVAQPAAQGESIDTPEFSALAARYATTKAGKDYMAMVARVHEWGASQRQEGRREGIEEAAAMYDTSPHAEEFRVNVAESIRALKSLATPAPTAGEPSAKEPDELCNSALRAEPAGQHDANARDAARYRLLMLASPGNIGDILGCGSDEVGACLDAWNADRAKAERGTNEEA